MKSSCKNHFPKQVWRSNDRNDSVFLLAACVSVELLAGPCRPLDVLVSRECAGGPERPRHECGHQAGQVSCSASTASSTCARRHLDAAHKLVAPAVGEVALFRANADSLTNLCGTRIDPGDCGL